MDVWEAISPHLSTYFRPLLRICCPQKPGRYHGLPKPIGFVHSPCVSMSNCSAARPVPSNRSTSESGSRQSWQTTGTRPRQPAARPWRGGNRMSTPGHSRHFSTWQTSTRTVASFRTGRPHWGKARMVDQPPTTHFHVVAPASNAVGTSFFLFFFFSYFCRSAETSGKVTAAFVCERPTRSDPTKWGLTAGSMVAALWSNQLAAAAASEAKTRDTKSGTTRVTVAPPW